MLCMYLWKPNAHKTCLMKLMLSHNKTLYINKTTTNGKYVAIEKVLLPFMRKRFLWSLHYKCLLLYSRFGKFCNVRTIKMQKRRNLISSNSIQIQTKSKYMCNKIQQNKLFSKQFEIYSIATLLFQI